MNNATRWVLQKISYFTLLLVLCLILITFYWTTRSYTPIEFEKDTFEVITKEVCQGDYLIYKIKYCKENDLIPNISSSFIDGIIYDIPAGAVPYFESGCYEKDFYKYVPKALPPGVYHLRSVYRFKVNPIRTIDITTKTEDFEVVSSN